jgi:hypothetical protein
MVAVFPSIKSVGGDKEKIKPQKDTSHDVGKIKTDRCKPKKKSAQ